MCGEPRREPGPSARDCTPDPLPRLRPAPAWKPGWAAAGPGSSCSWTCPASPRNVPGARSRCSASAARSLLPMPFTLQVPPLVAPQPRRSRAFKAVGALGGPGTGDRRPCSTRRKSRPSGAASSRSSPRTRVTPRVADRQAEHLTAPTPTGLRRRGARRVDPAAVARQVPSEPRRPSRSRGTGREGGARFIQNVAAALARARLDRPEHILLRLGRTGTRRRAPSAAAINRLVHSTPRREDLRQHVPAPAARPRRACAVGAVRRPAAARRTGSSGTAATTTSTRGQSESLLRTLDEPARAPRRDRPPPATWRLLQTLRSAGKEVWSYSYYMPTRRIPQLVIDGAPTDPRLLMLWNGYEGEQRLEDVAARPLDPGEGVELPAHAHARPLPGDALVDHAGRRHRQR